MAGNQKSDSSSVFGNSADPESQTDSGLGSSLSSPHSDTSSNVMDGRSSPYSDGTTAGQDGGSARKESTRLTLLGHDGDTDIVPVRNAASTAFFINVYLPPSTTCKREILTFHLSTHLWPPTHHRHP